MWEKAICGTYSGNKTIHFKPSAAPGVKLACFWNGLCKECGAIQINLFIDEIKINFSFSSVTIAFLHHCS